jgi:putative holliday junction resolvase
MGKILAIDYGQKKIGLAVTDIDRIMVFGRGIMENKNQDLVYKNLLQLIHEEKVEKIVVGLPLQADGNETEQTKRIRLFANNLKKFLHSHDSLAEIDFVDESFSTFEAQQFMKKLGIESKKQKQSEDELAAIFILQRYIDFKP